MSVSTLATLPNGGGVFSSANVDAVNAIANDQNANNTSLVASIAAIAGTGFTAANALTAHSGGGQGSALALTANINRVATVAAIADSVKLPTSVAGLLVVVINDAALALQAYGASTDTINDVVTSTGVEVPGKSTAAFFCPVAGVWYSLRLLWLGGQVLSADGAVLPHVQATYTITKSASACVLTLAAPTATVDDFKTITFTSSTDKAHTVTATGLFADGSTTTDVATFAAHAGASLTIMAYQAKWLVLSQNQITFS